MRVSSDMFLHNKADKIFSVDSSDLGHGWMEGVTLVSPRNTTANFFLKETHRDGTPDNEITHWTLVCSTNPKVAGYKMVIFND